MCGAGSLGGGLGYHSKRVNLGAGNGLPAAINISPVKPSMSKYCNDKSSIGQHGRHDDLGLNDRDYSEGAKTNSVQNVHQRLRDYQGSHGKTSVSKALFQAGGQQSSSPGGVTLTEQLPQPSQVTQLGSPSKLQSKTASAFGQNLRF